ncbi:hypothetical protein D3C83_284220 [compost metagenome]
MPIDFRSMRNQNRVRIVRDSSSSLFDVIHLIEVCIIDPGKMDQMMAALENNFLVEQYANVHVL